jgi:hypothetical protein
MNSLSVGDVFLTVAIMGVTFLAKIGLSSCSECSEKGTRSGRRVADARV